MSEPSYATARKLRIIEERLGSDWKTKHPNLSIDAVYNNVVGDERKNLFCKIAPESKQMLDEMVRYFDLKLAEWIERVIDEEHKKYTENKTRKVKEVARNFSGA